MIETKKTLDFLKEAMTLVEGDRALEYGDKVINHGNIAKLWSAYLDHPLTGHEVAVMMCLLKIARTKLGKRTGDTYVDGAAYMCIAGEIQEKLNGEDNPKYEFKKREPQ
jgi:hypothetical protein